MRSIVVLTLVAAVACSTASAQSFTRLVSFGDSLSDVGNVNGATFGISPGSSYYQGRFSNGNVWSERLSSQLGLGATQTPSRTSGGRNYAYGGVRSGSGNTNFFGIFNFPNAGAQIEQFLGSNTPASTDLYTLWIGGNDFLDGQTNVSIPANNVQAHLVRLAQTGAKNVIVANLPPLGETPRYVGNATDRATYNARSRAYNDALDARIATVRAQYPAVNFSLMDVEGVFDGILSSPGSFGFSNVKQPALNSGTVVPNPDQYLFFDDVHPTRVAHEYLGDYATQLLRERTWNGLAGNGNWSNANNWRGALVPDGHARVIIDDAAEPVAVSGFADVASVELSDSTLSLAASATLHASLSVRSGGVLTGSGTVDGTFNVDGGVIAPVGSLTLRAGICYAGSQVRLGANESVVATNRIDFQGADLVVDDTGASPIEPNVAWRAIVGRGEPLTPIVNATGLAGLWFEKAVGTNELAIVPRARPGDANLDSFVNFDDLLLLAASYNQSTGMRWRSGDFTGDGAVTFDDLLQLASNYNAPPAAGFAYAMAIPEPASMALGAALALSLRRRLS